MSTNPQTDEPTPENPASETPSPAPVTTDELLPPVEPPSAGFIIQLFVVPAVIVLVVVLLWVLVTTLATQGDQDPTKIVAALRSSNQARWQKAEELATMLRPDLEQRYPGLKSNAELAGQLAELLGEEIEAGLEDENSVNLRCFLCHALGAFYVDDGLEVLLKAAREDQSLDVRKAAVNAMAVLMHAFSEMEPPQAIDHPELVDTFVALANDPEDLIRSATAFALGVRVAMPDADPQLTVELENLVEDLYSDARYNAALGLARQGSLSAVEAVAEMFDPEALALNAAKEKTPAMQAFKRDTILDNALNAASVLVEKNPEAKLVELRTALEQFVASGATWQPRKVPPSLTKRGKELLELMQNQ